MRRALVAMLCCAGLAAAAPSKKVYAKDVKAALDQVEEQCKHLIRIKKINFGKLRARFLKESKKVGSLQEHYELLVRLVAAMRDGHGYVQVGKEAGKLDWPGGDLRSGPGLFLCRSGKAVYVKSAWSDAERGGVKPGMEVVAIDKIPALKWLDRRAAALAEHRSFSTAQQALFFTCHWGLGGKAGSTLKLELKEPGGKRKKITLTRGKASTVPSGPAFFPDGVQRLGRQSYGKTKKGFGYIHLRDTKSEIIEQMDTMLAAIGNVPGLILDFRANGGGAFDHDALLGRFVPKGEQLGRSKAYPIPSAGANPYGGPIVVIVDAGVRSAGETGSGMFKEDGRGYMIGEAPTAGMSSSKVTIPLPSKLFSLYLSVRSNKSRFQGGRGIEGIGIEPHEIVQYAPEDLASGVDTLTRRAEALLEKFPRNKVPYRPDQHGWNPPR